jgi:3',5'-cyclic AMP phosphodiesterase CpdA
LLESAPASAVKIAVLHHHVMQVRKGEDGPDYSILSDARDLLEMFRDTGVCAVIHGHGHRPFMESIGESHLAIVGAGSVGAAGQALPDEQRNTAHVIVMDRDASGDVVGVVRSTEYSRADNRWVVESLLGVHTYDAPRVYYIGARTKARLQEAVLGILSAAREKGAVYVKEYRQHAGLGDLDATALVEEVRRYVELLTTAEYSVIERAGGEDVQVHFEGQLHDA